MNPEYIATKINKANEFYGNYHGCFGYKETICGKSLDDSWYLIPLNIGDPIKPNVTCKKCLRVLNESTAKT